MGEATRSIVIENTQKAMLRKRPLKPLKVVTHGSKNVIAIKGLPAGDRVRSIAAKPSSSRQNPTIVSAHPYAVGNRDSASDFSDIDASNDNDVAISLHVPAAAPAEVQTSASAPKHALRHKVATGVLAALTIGAVVGGIQISGTPHDANGVSSQSQLSPVLDSNQPLTMATQDNGVALLPDAVLVERNNESIVEELNATSQQAQQYRDEIEQLRAVNASLLQEIELLSIETTDLNYDLLQLELVIAENKAKENGQQIVETRTVYNFVNVPIGTHVQNSGAQSYVNEQQYSEDESYAVVDNYYEDIDQYYEEPIAIEWDNNGEPIAFTDAYLMDEPMDSEIFEGDSYQEDLYQNDAYWDEMESYEDPRELRLGASEFGRN